MKKVIAALLTLCLVAVVIPPVPDGNDGENGEPGISTHEYYYQTENN